MYIGVIVSVVHVFSTHVYWKDSPVWMKGQSDISVLFASINHRKMTFCLIVYFLLHLKLSIYYAMWNFNFKIKIMSELDRLGKILHNVNIS